VRARCEERSEDDHVIHAFGANGTYQSFNVGSARDRGRESTCLIPMVCLVNEFVSKDPISITHEISRRAVPRKGLPQLLDHSIRSRMHRHREVFDSSALMRQDEKYVEDLKPDSRHG